VWNECHPDGVSDDDSVAEDLKEEKEGKEERKDERKDESRVAKVDEEEDGHRSSSGRETPRVEIEFEKLYLSSADEAEVDG
jgi:poly(3-hydroxybutyrate) depolymerase